MKRVLSYIVAVVLLSGILFNVNMSFISAANDNDVFEPYINETVPNVVGLGETTLGNITVKKFLFESVESEGIPTEVYALIAYPDDRKTYPGILTFHEENGTANADMAISYAEKGYVCMSFEIPGLADPDIIEDTDTDSGLGSKGAWKNHINGWNLFDVSYDVNNNTVFQAVVASIQAFNILASQDNVDEDNIGIIGTSWGGYLTTMVSGLLGDRVAAAYSIYGSGFYDLGSSFRSELLTLSEEDQQTWLERYDAGRKAKDITAPYFMAASAKDQYFWTTSVVATFNEIQSPKNIIWGTEWSHSLIGIADADNIPYKYFDYYLKGEGEKSPEIKVEGYEKQSNGSILLTFGVDSESELSSTNFYYASPIDWEGKDQDTLNNLYENRSWYSMDVKSIGNNKFTVVINAALVKEDCDWFVTTTNTNNLTGASIIYSASDESIVTAPVEPEPEPISIKLVIDSKIAVVNNEKIELDVPAMQIDDRTFTPARFVAENLGAKVDWDEDTETVTITSEEHSIILVIGSKTAIVDGNKVELDVPVMKIDDRTLTPARFVAENLGATVDWNEDTKTVTIIK